MRSSLPFPIALVVLSGCGHSPSDYLAKGQGFSEKHQYGEAALNYRKAIQKDPSFGEAYYRLGLTELRLNMGREAYQDLSRAVTLLPNRDDVKVMLADLSFDAYVADRTRPTIFYEQVIKLSDQLIANNPKSFDGFRLKAYLAASDKRFKDAEKFFQKANAIKPMQPELIVNWTRVLFEDNRPAEGEQLARQLIKANVKYGPIYDELFAHYTLLKKPVEAEAILKTEEANNPSGGGAALQLATFYAAASREDEMKAVLQRMLDNPATFQRAHLQVGEFYERMQRWNDAIQQYEQGAQASPTEKTLYLKKIVNVWLAQGKGEQASSVVSEILKQEPSDEETQAVRASLQLATGRPQAIKEAVSEFQSLAKKSPENAVWRFNLGRALAAQGDSAGAKKEYLEAAHKKPDFLSPRIALVQQSQGEGDHQSALHYANEILATHPNLPGVRMLRAISLINTRNYTQAHEELTKLERVFPDEVQLQSAMLDLRERKFKEAEDRFRKLLEKDPHNALAMLGLVQTEAAQNQLEKAMQLLRQALDRSPSSEIVRSLLADVEVAAGKFDSAIEEFQRLLLMQPRSAQYHLLLGRAYQLKGDLGKAVPELREAGSLAPKDPGPPVLLAHAMIASGQTDEAMRNLRYALRLRPENAAVMNDLAYLIVESPSRRGNLDEALALAQKAVHAAPDDPEMADTLAWIYFQKNQNDSSLQILRGLVLKYPTKSSFRYHLGMALVHAGDKAAAKLEFETALTMSPAVELRSQIETAVANLR